MIDPQSPLPLLELTTGMPIPFGGDRVTVVTPELAAAFLPGDRLVVVQTNGHLLHIAQRDATLVATAVAEAQRAFHALASVSDDQITTFYDAFARRLASDESDRKSTRLNSSHG